MTVRCTIVVVLGLVFHSASVVSGYNNTDYDYDYSYENSTEDRGTSSDEITESLGSAGYYGGYYYNVDAVNLKNKHYIHGSFQPPTKNYYKKRKYFRVNDTKETFDFYVGYALFLMKNNTNPDFYYDDFQWYYHDINRTIEENEKISLEFVISCTPDMILLCPENTEPICLLNGTIYCMTKIDVVEICPHNESQGCIDTMVPCVKRCRELNNNFEQVHLPCLSTVIMDDVWADGKGKTLNRVAGTFMIVDEIPEKDRTFCVTVIIDPRATPRNDHY